MHAINGTSGSDGPGTFGDGRLAAYGIGRAVDLAALDAILTRYMAAVAAIAL